MKGHKATKIACLFDIAKSTTAIESAVTRENLSSFISTYSDDDTEDNYNENQKNIENLKKKLIFRPQHSTKFIIDNVEIKLYEDKVESEKSVRENLLYNLKIYLLIFLNYFYLNKNGLCYFFFYYLMYIPQKMRDLSA